MSNKKNLFDKLQVYEGGFTSRVSTGIKILCFLIYAILIFFIDDLVKLLLGCIVMIFLYFISKVNMVSIIKSMWVIMIGFALIAFINIFFIYEGNVFLEFYMIKITDVGITRAVVYSARLVLLFLDGGLLLATTQPLDLIDSLTKILSPLSKFKIPISQISFIIMLSLRFFPIIANNVTIIKNAQICRGASFDRGSINCRLKTFFSILMPILVSSIRQAEELSLSLLSRNYEPGAKRTKWNTRIFFEYNKEKSQNQ